MMGGRQWGRVVAAVLVVGAIGALAGGASATTVPVDEDTALDAVIVREVPGEYDTIQAAVTAAAPGDLVLISPGTYAEAVDVTTDNLTIRGLDRDGVVLDGGFELQNGIRVLGADGVAVENMTAQNYTVNGFFWTGVEGYRASYLTALRNGDYGIYAFDAVRGQIEHSYTSGSPDAGVYIGQCYPCDAVIDDVVSEHNGLGYSGTNSGGNLLIVNSTFRNNRAGIVPNSGSYELCYPERETTIVGNIVHGNQQPDTSAIPVALTAMGNGILIAGGVGNLVERNLVYDHDLYGIALAPFDETGANDDHPTREEWATSCADARAQTPATSIPETIFWESFDNVVRDNVIEDSRYADIGVAILTVDPATAGNCFAGNTFTASAPTDIEALAPCDGTGAGDWTLNPVDLGAIIARERPPAVDYDLAELPPVPEQPEMADAATSPPAPAVDVPFAVDLAAIPVPTRP